MAPMTPETLARWRNFALLINSALLGFAIYLILTGDPAGWQNLAIPAVMMAILLIAGRRRAPR